MKKKIPKIVQEDESLVRLIFRSNFKKKKEISKEFFEKKSFLLPNKGGVSIQRGLHCDDCQCQKFASSIPSKTFAGLYKFSLNRFRDFVTGYRNESCSYFEADVFASPIDENNEYRTLPIDSSEFDILSGNPAHADIIYINPGVQTNESPNTAIRSFVRKFYSEEELMIENSLQA